MAAIKDTVFGPMLPKTDAELLPNNAAQFAQNLKHTSGALEAWKLPAPVAGVAMPGTDVIRTIYRFGKDTSSKVNYWLQFAGDVDITKGPINADDEERTYWTDGAYPKKTRISLAGLLAGTAILPTSLRLGVPPPGWNGVGGSPTYTPFASVSGAATDPASVQFTAAFVVTYVSTWGEESAPSLASNVVTWRAGQTPSVTLPGAATGPYDINLVRLYRSATGTSRTTYQRSAELAVGTASYADTKTQSQLGEVCPTFDWNPPSDLMIGLIDMGNGMMAGFERNTVYFCEPNAPYAWPAKYDATVASPIIALGHFDQTLVVGTESGLVLMTGVDPSAMSQESLKGSKACVSKRSMKPGLGGVIYASPVGLEFVGPGAPGVNLTDKFLSKEQWESYNPPSIEGYVIDGRYYAFYDNGTKGCLIFTFGDAPGMTLCDQHTTAAYVENRTDGLFLVKRAGSVNTLNEWGTGASMTVTWRGKEHRYDSGVCMSRAVVKASSYPVTYKLFGDGVLKHTQVVADQFPFALPAGRNYTVSHQVEAATKVTLAAMATSTKELGNG